MSTSLTDNLNHLQPTQFKIVINRPTLGNFEFFAQSVEHPDVNASPSVLQFRKTDAFFPGDKLEYGQLTLNAIIDEDMNVYNEVYNWMLRMVEEYKVTPETTNDELSIYDISVIILSNQNNRTKEIKYKGAFPISIGGVSFTASSAETYIVMPVTFQYTQFNFT